MASFRLPRSLVLISFLQSFLFVAFAISQELESLSYLKNTFKDPENSLSSWRFGSQITSPCSFQGVHCNKQSKIVSLSLQNVGLQGKLSRHLGGLVSLTRFSVANNSLSGKVPSEIVNCRNLTYLDLSQNYFSGPLPDFFSQLPQLEYLDLSGNYFNGSIPPDTGRIAELQTLSLYNNLLYGRIPAFLSNLTNLRFLLLANNIFESGPIPSEIFNITALDTIWLTSCNLIGSVPDSLDRLIHLRSLDLSRNMLTGPWPKTIFRLSKLESLQIYENSLSGSIPDEFERMVALKSLDASNNSFTGHLPQSLGNLTELEILHLYINSFSGLIPESIAGLPKLEDLILFQNHLSGVIPESLGANGKLRAVDLSSNELIGPLPSKLCYGGTLTLLVLFRNNLNGRIPGSYGSCRSLNRLRLGENFLVGEVPKGVWGLPHLSFLELRKNKLEGSISSNIRHGKELSRISIEHNRFSGIIPREIVDLRNLTFLDVSNNRFSGSLPSDLGKLSKLVNMNVRTNMLSESIPTSILPLKQLTVLDLKDNRLSGEIPYDIGKLKTLVYLDLSENELDGEVPQSLAELNLNFLNLSNNMLSGSVSSVFRDTQGVFVGNPQLCGDGNTDLKPCSNTKKPRTLVLSGIFAFVAILLAISLGYFIRVSYLSKARLHKGHITSADSRTVTLFHKLPFQEKEITQALTESNVIARGGAGKVYRAVLRNGETVAVKMLPGIANAETSGHDNGFKAEVETLGMIRHKNIVKLLGYISREDFNLLVYEYMPNGSLGDILGSPRAENLDWPTRFRIALDSASGIAYLHHDLVYPVIHRDIKPNNILLDAQLHAYVADFGLARIAEKCQALHETMSAFAGSYGYIAPEHSHSIKVTQKSDVYSFGVLLLELLSSRPPVDPSYGEGMNIVMWVIKLIQNEDGWQVILDPRLCKAHLPSMKAVLNIAVQCTSTVPKNRPTMRQVVELLKEADPCLGSKHHSPRN